MKKLLSILTFTFILFCCFTFGACCNYSKIEKALTDNGYSVIEGNSVASQIQKESTVYVDAHLFDNVKALTTVVVFEFKSTEDMKKFFTDSETLQGIINDVDFELSKKDFYDDLVQKGYANGNCLVVAIGDDDITVYQIIKNLKV